MDFDEIRQSFFNAFDSTVQKIEEMAIDTFDKLEEFYQRYEEAITA